MGRIIKFSNDKISYLCAGTVTLKKRHGKFTIRNFDKFIGDFFHITTYAIHGFGPIYFEKREGNTFYIYSNDDTKEAGYQIIGFTEEAYRSLNIESPSMTPQRE